MITYTPRYEFLNNKAVGSRIGVFCLLGSQLVFCFLFVTWNHLWVSTIVRGSVSRVFSFCLQRILRVLVFELRAAHRCIARMCSFLFAHHQLSSAEQVNHPSTYRPGVAEQHLLCWSSLLLQAHLTVAFVCLKSYI